MERKTFTIRFIVKDKSYKKVDYPFPDFQTLGSILETILEIMAERPEEMWEERFTKGYAKLLPYEEGEKADYTFYSDEKGVYDQDHNFIDTIENRIKVWHDPKWKFDATDKDYRADPLGLAVPESMEDGEALRKRLLKSSLEVLSESIR